MKLKLFYMSGAGNLFTVINNSIYKLPEEKLEMLAQDFCNINEYNDFRTEGFMAIDKSELVDFDVKFFNPDGSSGMMCGNGGRCAVRFAVDSGIRLDVSRFHNFTMAGDTYKAEIIDENISLEMPPAKKYELNNQITVHGNIVEFDFVDVGTEHVVINIDKQKFGSENKELDKIDIEKIGSSIRRHNYFPTGTNVNFMAIRNGIVHMRTYERGVEAETGACGTGAVSTAIIANLKYGLDFPISLIPTSGEMLIVDIPKPIDALKKNIYLKGNAKIIETKEIEVENDS